MLAQDEISHEGTDIGIELFVHNVKLLSEPELLRRHVDFELV